MAEWTPPHNRPPDSAGGCLPLRLLRFVRGDGFVRDWQELRLTDDDLAALESLIMAAPRQAPIVPGTGGLRKLRFVPPRWKIGKSGALRVCYAYFEGFGLVYIFSAYAKTAKRNLSSDEKVHIGRLIRETESYLRKGAL